MNKLEDSKGYSLSNTSLVGDFLSSGDKVYAYWESLQNSFSLSIDPDELI